MNNIIKYILNNSEKVKIHSNDISDGDVFLALQGNKNHGNNFINKALDCGAKYVLTNKMLDKKFQNSNILYIRELLNFLLKIASQKRSLYKGNIIAITGSVGKTSVKENLKYLLSPYFKVSASIKSYNNHLGVIISILNLDLESDYGIFELGTNDFNEIGKLTNILLPNQTIITNIYPVHLEKLINTNNIAKEKSDIFNVKYNPNIKMVILPYDNVDEKKLLKIAIKNKIKDIFIFGNNQESTLRIDNIENLDHQLSKIKLYYDKKQYEFTINNNQLYRINNVLICMLIFIYNNINIDYFTSICKNIPLIEGRGLQSKIIINNKKVKIIDESYNASPQTMKNSIDYFEKIKTTNQQKKYLILGDMCELGVNEISFHIELLIYLSKKNLKNVIICGDLMKIALEKTLNKNILYMLNSELIFNYIAKNININDVILIKGSNSSITNILAKKLLSYEVT